MMMMMMMFSDSKGYPLHIANHHTIWRVFRTINLYKPEFVQVLFVQQISRNPIRRQPTKHTVLGMRENSARQSRVGGACKLLHCVMGQRQLVLLMYFPAAVKQIVNFSLLVPSTAVSLYAAHISQTSQLQAIHIIACFIITHAGKCHWPCQFAWQFSRPRSVCFVLASSVLGLISKMTIPDCLAISLQKLRNTMQRKKKILSKHIFNWPRSPYFTASY